MNESRNKIKRLDRLIEIRQIAVDEAEARVHESQAELHRFEARLAVEEGKIRQLTEEFAHPDRMMGVDLKQSEAAAQAARIRSARINQDIEKASLRLEERRQQWMETQRDRKTVEKLRERELQRAVREEEALMQKVTDESAIIRHGRRYET